jgi:hypothetical protein
MCFVFSLNCGPFSKEHDVHLEKQIKHNSHPELFCKVYLGMFQGSYCFQSMEVHMEDVGSKQMSGSSYGWLPITIVGQLTGWSIVTTHTWTNASCKTKKMRQFTTCWSCVFARQFWFTLLQRCGFLGIDPVQSDKSFDDWFGLVPWSPITLEKTSIPCWS